MEAKENAAEKRIVDQLTFGEKTVKRAKFEAFECTVVGPYEVEVTNASYGDHSDGHSYRVFIDQHGVPVSCSCPGFRHHYGPKDKADKHMVALATMGGPTALQAAIAFENPTSVSNGDRVATDGGDWGQREGSDECRECEGRFPCWDCVESGRRSLPV